MGTTPRGAFATAARRRVSRSRLCECSPPSDGPLGPLREAPAVSAIVCLEEGLKPNMSGEARSVRRDDEIAMTTAEARLSLPE